MLGKPRTFGACGVTSASVYAGTGFPPTFELPQAAGSPLLPWGKGGSQLPQAPSSPCGRPGQAIQWWWSAVSTQSHTPKVFLGVFMLVGEDLA